MARRERLAVALLLAGTLAAAEDDLQRAFAASYAAENAGDLAGAATALAPHLAARPGDYLLNLRLGWLAYRRGEHGQAVTWYRTASLGRPASLEARLGLIAPLMALQRWSEARSEAFAVLAVEPGQVAASLLLAEILLKQGYPRSADDIAARLVAAYPADATCAALRARTQAALGVTAVAASAPALAAPVEPAPLVVGITAYGGGLAYGGATTRSWAALGGLTLGLSSALGEAAFTAEYTKLTFTNRDPFTETDLNLVLGRWLGPVYLRGGAHAIHDREHGWGAGKSVFAGAWWQTWSWLGFGCDVAWSRFHVTEPAVAAWQAVPRLGWWQDLGSGWRVGQDLDLTAIRLDRDLGQGEAVLWSAGTRAWVARDDWSLAVGGWLGDRIYAIAPDGSAVHDLPARYRHGWEVTLGRSWNRHLSTTLTGGRDSFAESWNAERATAQRLVIACTITF
jgi:hypothetical protein